MQGIRSQPFIPKINGFNAKKRKNQNVGAILGLLANPALLFLGLGRIGCAD